MIKVFKSEAGKEEVLRSYSEVGGVNDSGNGPAPGTQGAWEFT